MPVDKDVVNQFWPYVINHRLPNTVFIPTHVTDTHLLKAPRKHMHSSLKAQEHLLLYPAMDYFSSGVTLMHSHYPGFITTHPHDV